MTTHAAVLIQDWNSPYRVYYARMDGYPSSLGERLIRELIRRCEDIRAGIKDAYTIEDEIVAQLGLVKKDGMLDRHEKDKVFTEWIGDLEWVYTVDNFAHVDTCGVTIYKTSNLVKCEPFIWRVWDRVLEYVGQHDTELTELMRQVELIGDASKQMLMGFTGVETQ